MVWKPQPLARRPAGLCGQPVLAVLSTAGIVLGTVIGLLNFGWTPSEGQILLTAAMIATSIYGWKQRNYFEQ